MPKYTVITVKTVEYEYDLDLNLPLDMGSDNDRIADMQIRKAYAAGTLMTTLDLDSGGPVRTDDNGEEKILAIFRDNKQLIPRLRKDKPTKAENFAKNVIAQKNTDIFGDDSKPDPLTED